MIPGILPDIPHLTLRQQFPKTVMEMMDKDERVIVILGDIGVFAFKDVFAKYPKRCYNIGICEQSMVSIAAGLAIAGFIPIIHTISPFLVLRAYEQIRDDFGFQNLIGTFVGADVYETNPNLGLTHSCPEDLEMMERIPNMRVHNPESALALRSLLTGTYDKYLNYFRIV